MFGKVVQSKKQRYLKTEQKQIYILLQVSEDEFLLKLYCLKGIVEHKSKRGKRLEKNLSPLKFRIENRKNRKSLKNRFL